MSKIINLNAVVTGRFRADAGNIVVKNGDILAKMGVDPALGYGQIKFNEAFRSIGACQLPSHEHCKLIDFMRYFSNNDLILWRVIPNDAEFVHLTIRASYDAAVADKVSMEACDMFDAVIEDVNLPENINAFPIANEAVVRKNKSGAKISLDKNYFYCQALPIP